MKKQPHKLIVDTIQDGVFVIVDGKLVFVNESFCRIVGYKKEELIGKNYMRLCHEDDYEFVSSRHNKRKAGKDVPNEYEFRLRHKNGNVIYITMALGISEYEGQKAITGTIKDITDRIVNELKIKEVEESYRTLLELSPDPIVVLDSEGTILIHNQVTLDVVESNNVNFQLTGKNILDFIDDTEELNKIKGYINGTNKFYPIRCMVHIKTLKDRVIPFDLNMNTIVNDSKNVIVIARDVSQIKKYEYKLKKLITEKEFIIKEIHHRIKNSLQQIYSLLGIQAEKSAFKYSLFKEKTELTDACESNLQSVISNARQRILAISTIHSMLYQETSNTIDFFEFLNRLSKYIKDEFSPPNKNIEVNILGDELQLSLDNVVPCGLILNEIITNSFKYAFENKEKGNINVELKSKESVNIINISDDGIGISDNKAKFSAGLGFSLIRGLTEQIGGTVEMSSDSKGTKYQIKFNKNT